jgi:hypothetical protein
MPKHVIGNDGVSSSILLGGTISLTLPPILARRTTGQIRLGILEQLLGSGDVDIRRNAHPTPPDRYGRTLARVLVDGEDVACILIKEG